jgi:hypothetical protein
VCVLMYPGTVSGYFEQVNESSDCTKTETVSTVYIVVSFSRRTVLCPALSILPQCNRARQGGCLSA